MLKALLLCLCTCLHQQAQVRSRRGEKLDATREDEIFSGDFWIAQDAQDLGLIDGIADMTPTLQDKFGDGVKEVPIAVGRQLPWPLAGMNVLGSPEPAWGASTSSVVNEVLDALEERTATRLVR